MSASVVTWAAHTSLAALPLALAVLLLARVRFVHPRWRTWIAALLFLRLALPAVPQVSWNVWSIHPASRGVTECGSATTAGDRGGVTSASTTARARFDLQAALAWLWVCGFATTACWLAASHFLTRRWILRKQQPPPRWFDALASWARERQGVTRPVPVLVVRGLTTMAVFGWIRPRLLIPADLPDRYTAEQIRGMLLHEFAHVRRRDVLWTWLALLACALHWFNPLAWLAFRRFCADRELICDAAALATLGESGRHSYGDALLRSLDIAPLAPTPSLAPFFRIHPEVKHRILMITKPLQPTVWSRFAAALLVPGLCLIAFTTSRAQSEGEKPSREGEKAKSESREGERRREGTRDGDTRKAGARDGEARKESDLDRYKRENAERKERARTGEAARDGERPREGARDGERSRSFRDGEMKREGSREGARDGDSRRNAERDGDRSREGTRESDARRRSDAETKRSESRDGENRKSGPRDGEVRKAGPRDGEVRKEGTRDGEKREGDKRE